MKGSSHLLTNLMVSTSTTISLQLPLKESTLLVVGAVTTCSFPDQIEYIKLTGHRKWTHNILLYAILIAVINNFYPNIFSNYFVIGSLYGILLHILGDMFSKQGVPFILNDVKFKIPLYTTGKGSETFFLLLLLVASIICPFLINK